MTTELVSTSFARAGLLGNPSDGYGGKAIAFSVRNFLATVRIRPSKKIEIVPSPNEANTSAESIADLVANLQNYGYYGGTRLLKAAIQRFFMFCQSEPSGRFDLHNRNFVIDYQTNIPRSVGLAGSSAIITAALKSLVRFYQLDVPAAVLATLALEAERDLLGIPAGLMDRAIQMLEGIVFMDFSSDGMTEVQGVPVGDYHSLPIGDGESSLFLAWADQAAEPTEVLHNRLKERFQQGDKVVCLAMQRFAEIAAEGRKAWQEKDLATLGSLIDENFDLRASICQLPRLHEHMVRVARQSGGTAKFCGSGGAIVGTATDPAVYQSICIGLNSIGCQVIRPIINQQR